MSRVGFESKGLARGQRPYGRLITMQTGVPTPGTCSLATSQAASSKVVY